MFEGILEQAKSAGFPTNAETKARLKKIEDALKYGRLHEVDSRTGLLRRVEFENVRLEFGEVRWLEKPPEISVPKGLPDRSSPLPPDRDDLVMIGHSAMWRPGMASMDTDGRLLNIRTGEMRRIPFDGVITMAGCFVADRNAVVVTGAGLTQGGFGLYLIDLATGVNRRLGGEELVTGMSMGPCLSPDGRTVAVMHKTSEGELLDWQMYLIDLESGRTRAVGKPFDGHSLSWLGDGSGLIGVRRHEVPGEKFHAKRIVRIGLDGAIEELRSGDFAQVIGRNRDRILFQDDDDQWYTCDLTGANVKKVGDGLPGHQFPTISPDGERVLLMSFSKGRGPLPVEVSLADGKVTPTKAGPGLWVMPGWR